VELSFEAAPDPFGQAFAEEEVLIDRYASLESAARTGPTRVNSEEGRQIAAALWPEPSSLVPAQEAPQPVATPETGWFQEIIDPASDPVLPESGMQIVADVSPSEFRSAAAIAASARREHEEQQTKLRLAMTDDRDAIVVDDPRPDDDTDPPSPSGKPRRREYRQLFARLRRG
jgi:hypothetical protein